MNSKTAKIINKYALYTGKPSKNLKQTWNKRPWTARAALRQEIKTFNDKAKAQREKK